MPPESPKLAVIGLGASLGDRRGRLELAVRLLAAEPGVEVLACSRLYRTPPWGGVARNHFLNAAVLLSSPLTPAALLARCQHIERRLGRRPGRRWGDRAVDLDLLLVEGTTLDSADFRLPHPRIAERSFVVRPLEDVLPGAVNPASGATFLAEHIALGIAAAWPRPVSVGVLARPRCRKVDRPATPQRSVRRTP